jgi:hypothetical protein
MPGIGYYTLPVILSFQGIDKQINTALGDKLKPAAKKAGEDIAKGVAEGAKTGGKTAAESISKPIIAAAKKTGTDAGKQLDQTLKVAVNDFHPGKSWKGSWSYGSEVSFTVRSPTRGAR